MQWRNQNVDAPPLATLAETHAYGRKWYAESGQSLAEYAARIGEPEAYVCDVVAILSPRVSVAQNLKLAQSYLETGSAPGAMRQRLHALAKYEASGVFTGPKVNAFSLALQGDEDATVIDAWMFRLLGTGKARGVKAYREAAGKVRGVAAELGWQAAETQAALWCGARSLCGFQDAYSPLVVA